MGAGVSSRDRVGWGQSEMGRVRDTPRGAQPRPLAAPASSSSPSADGLGLTPPQLWCVPTMSPGSWELSKGPCVHPSTCTYGAGWLPAAHGHPGDKCSAELFLTHPPRCSEGGGCPGEGQKFARHCLADRCASRMRQSLWLPGGGEARLAPGEAARPGAGRDTGSTGRMEDW